MRSAFAALKNQREAQARDAVRLRKANSVRMSVSADVVDDVARR